MRLRATVLAACAGLAAPAGPIAGQEVRTAVVADTVRVGDIVPVAVRVTLEPGQRVIWPDTLPLEGVEAENAARVRERVDTLADGSLQVTGIYSVMPWRTGQTPLPDVAVRVIGSDEGPRTLTASIPTLDVVSVLPPDTAGIEPRPAKGVIGRSWSLWPLLLALLALLAIIGGIIAWIRRRGRGGAEVAEPPVSPREAALAALQSARDAGLIERGQMRELYTRISGAVRAYVAALEPSWGEDLTTTELVGRFRAGMGPAAASQLAGVLRPADQVKFARREPDAATATAEWEAARRFVAEFDGPHVAERSGEAA